MEKINEMQQGGELTYLNIQVWEHITVKPWCKSYLKMKGNQWYSSYKSHATEDGIYSVRKQFLL